MRIKDRRDERRRGRGGDFGRSRRNFDDERRGSYDDYGNYNKTKYMLRYTGDKRAQKKGRKLN